MKKVLYYIFLFFFIQIVCEVICFVVLACVNGGTEGKTQAIIGGAALSSVVAVIFYVWRKYWKINLSFLRTKPYSILALVVLLTLTSIFPSTWIMEQLPEQLTQDLLSDTFDSVLGSSYGIWAVGILVPIAEEVVFRGAILGELLRKWSNKPWRAIVLSALIFSIAHMNPAQIPHAFVFGLLLGWMYYRTDSLLPGIVYHIVNNSIPFAMVYFIPDMQYDSELIEITHDDATLLYTIIAISTLIFIPTLWLLNKKLPMAEREVQV